MRGWRRFGRWLSAHLFVGALGISGMVGLDMGLTVLKRRIFLPGPHDVTLWLGLGGLWLGALLGGGQRWALRSPEGSALRWVFWSGLGSALGWLGLWGMFWAIGPERLIPPGTSGMQAWAWILSGLGLGAGLWVGIAQWIGLGRSKGAMGGWAALSGLGGGVAGWGIGVAMIQLGEETLEQWGVLSWALLGAIGGGIFGLLTAPGPPSPE